MTTTELLKAHGLTTQDEADELLVKLAQMAVQCAWCGSELRAGDPSLPTSHGICPDCKARLEREAA